jgi:hypothetical protein
MWIEELLMCAGSDDVPRLGDAPDIAPIAGALTVKAGVHGDAMIGGIGLKAVDLRRLQAVARSVDGAERLRCAVRRHVDAALAQAGISYGLDDEAVDLAVADLLQGIAAGEERIVTQKVAEGEAAVPGSAAAVEYALNYRGRPFHELAGLELKSRRKQRRVVNGGDLIALLLPPVPAQNGVNVRGETIEPPAEDTDEPSTLDEVAGLHTTIQGANLVAACDGICEEDARGHVRVIPQIDVARIYDATGRVPESGISGANVTVARDIRGAGVATTETVLVGTDGGGGGIEGSATVRAANLFVAGRVVGESTTKLPALEVDELCAVYEVLNRPISCGTLLVARDCQFARIEFGETARVDGSLRGGSAACHGLLQVMGDLGTPEGGSQTRMLLPAANPEDRRHGQLTSAVAHYRSQLAELQQKAETRDKRSEKRARADAYWAGLVQGERTRARSRLQAKALGEFVTFTSEKRALTRHIDGVKGTLGQLAEDIKGLEESDTQPAAAVSVAGTVFLDVSFEISREMSPEDGELAVKFEDDGKEYLRSSLGQARGVLSKEVREYCQQQNVWLEEKKAALTQMFKGQENRPADPEMEDKVFRLPIAFLDAEPPELVKVTAVLSVHAREPNRFLVRSTARLREPRQDVTVTMTAQGGRGEFSVAENASELSPWRQDAEIIQMLEGLVMGETSPAELLGVGDRADGNPEPPEAADDPG